MPHIKHCTAQLTLRGPWGYLDLQPGMPVDLDRVLTPAREAVAAKGQPGTDGYVPEQPEVQQFTVADAVHGKETDWFSDTPPADEPAETSSPAEMQE